MDLLPDTYSEVIFNFGDGCQIDTRQFDGREVPFVLPACYRVGLFDQPFRLQAHGLLRTIGVRFYAWGLHPLFDSASTEQPLVGNMVYALDHNWHQLASALSSSLQEGDERAIQLLDAYLLERRNRLHLEHDHLVTELPNWVQPDELTTVEQWADESHLSRRQLERRFQKLVGLSPKALARRVRFERTRDHLCHQPEIDLSTLALAYGYADQAHFGRDFKYFTHRTPRQFVAQIQGMPESLRYGVAFLPR